MPKKPFEVLFLCTGNICRSPMAEGLLRDALDPRRLAGTRVTSAGVAAMDGQPASEHAVTACAEVGADIARHRSRRYTPALAREADLILAMELHHVIQAGSISPDHSDKLHLLSQFAAGAPDGIPYGVDDPIGGSLEEYRATRDVLTQYINQALPRILSAIEAGVVES